MLYVLLQLTKEDSAHADPLSRVLGPADELVYCFSPSPEQADSAHWMSDTARCGLLQSWVIVTGKNDFVLQL